MAQQPIIRSPMRPAKKGQPPTVEWARWVENTLRRIIDQPSFRNRPINGGAQDLQFKIYAVRYDSTEEKWYCKVRPGWVRNRNPDSAATDVIKDWMPEAGDPAVALDAAEPPEIEIADGQTVYCRVATTDKGIIQTAPTIEAAATPTNGAHFQPPNAATNGDLYFPLCNVTITGDPAVVTLEQIQQGGPIHVTPNLPEIKNIGGEIEVFKERTPAGDTYDFRTLEQLEGAGEPVIRVDDPQGDTVPFRRIAPRATAPQINVDAISDDIIRIKGNGNDLTYTDPFGGMIDFVDGLVTSVTPGDVEGGNFNIKLLNVSIVETSGDTYVSDIGWGSAGERRFYVRNGLLTLVDDLAAVDEYEVISRIEGETFAIDPTNQSGDGFTAAP